MNGSFQANSAGPGQSGDPSMEDILASIRRILSEDDTKQAPAAEVPAPALRPVPRAEEVLALDESMLVREPKPAFTPVPTPAPLANGLSAGPLAALGSFMTAPTQPDIVAEPARPAPQHLAERLSERLHDDDMSRVHPPSAGTVFAAPVAPVVPAPVPTPPLAPTLSEPAERSEAPVERFEDVTPLVAPEAADAASASMATLRRTITADRHTPVHRGGPTLEDMMREEMRPMLKEWLDSNLPGLVERLVKAEIDRVSGRAAL